MHISLAPEALFNIGPLTITNSMFTAVLTSLIIGVAVVIAARRLKLSPVGGFAGIIETVSEVLLDQMEQVFGSHEVALKHFPLLATIFLFVLGNNWLSLMPGFGAIVVNGDVPLLRSVSADLNATLGLALVSVILTQIYAIQALGIVGNFRRYISTDPLLSVIGLLEVVLEVARVISFAFRLFGNIFAGEVLLIVISALLPLVGPVPFWGLELFVGFIQALVFTMLTMVFIAVATGHETHIKEQIKE